MSTRIVLEIQYFIAGDTLRLHRIIHRQHFTIKSLFSQKKRLLKTSDILFGLSKHVLHISYIPNVLLEPHEDENK